MCPTTNFDMIPLRPRSHCSYPLVVLLTFAAILLQSSPSCIVQPVYGQSLSSSDFGSDTRQLTTAASTLEQMFPTNQGQSSNSDPVENRIVRTLLPIRGAVIFILQGLMQRAATAYQAQNPSFQMDFLFPSSNPLVKTAYINTGGFDYGVLTTTPVAADYAVKPGIVFYPLQANGIVPVYNLPSGVNNGATLALSGITLCRIFRGNITQWTDPAITQANPAMSWALAAGKPINILLINSISATNLALTTYCRKVDSGFKIAANSNPAWPTNKYGATASYANLDLVNSAIVDTPFSLAVTVLANAKAIEVPVANMINSQGAVLTCNTNSMSLNLFELATNGYSPGTNSYDLTAPATPQAWPMLSMSYLFLDQQQTLTTCASKKLMLEFFLWFYTSDVVASVANSLSVVVLPSMLVDQLQILQRLRAEVLCQATMLVASNSHEAFLGINALAAPLVSLYSSFYLAVDNSRSYTVNSATESLMVQRVVAGELEVALVDMQQMADQDIELMRGNAVPVPAFMSGVAPIFTLPLAITKMYANTITTTALGLPPLYPLILNLDVMTSLFLGEISSWLDPLLTNLNPQLLKWFAATSADPTLTLVVGASRGTDSLKGALMLFNVMRTSAVGQRPENAIFFPTDGWVSADGTIVINPFMAVQSSSMTVANMTIIEVESRLTLKSSMLPGSVSYHLLGSTSTSTGKAVTDPTVEFQMQITNSAGVIEVVEPTAVALKNCAIVHTTLDNSLVGISDPLSGVDVNTMNAQINQMLDVTVQRSWVNPVSPQPGCWPVSALLSFVVPTSFTSSVSAATSSSSVSTSTATANTCDEGTHALEFVHFIQSTPLLSAAAESFGLIRLSESSLVRKMTEQVLYSAKCDDTTLLVIQPYYYSIPSSVTSFGFAVAVIGIFLAVISALVVFFFRSEMVIRSASAPFLLFILLGMALLFGAIASWSVAPSSESCAGFGWMINLGFMMLFGPLFLKTWRVWRIFSGAQLKVVKLSNNKLMVMMAIAVLVDVILLSAWQAVSPMTPIQYSKLIGSTYNYYTHCSVNPKGMPFVYVEGIYKCGLLLFGSVMAFSTRNVKGTFNEATQIAWSIYNTLATGLITVVIIVFIAAVETTLIVLVQIFILWLACCTWALLFIPKFHLLFQSEAQQIEASRSELPQEKSGGFSFASVAVMSAIQLKQYYNALKIQMNKVEKRLGFKVTTFQDAVVQSLPGTNSADTSTLITGKPARYSIKGGDASIGSELAETDLGPDPEVSRERSVLVVQQRGGGHANNNNHSSVSARPSSPSRNQVNQFNGLRQHMPNSGSDNSLTSVQLPNVVMENNPDSVDADFKNSENSKHPVPIGVAHQPSPNAGVVVVVEPSSSVSAVDLPPSPSDTETASAASATVIGNISTSNYGRSSPTSSSVLRRQVFIHTSTATKPSSRVPHGQTQTVNGTMNQSHLAADEEATL